jgi:hypothetical protein
MKTKIGASAERSGFSKAAPKQRATNERCSTAAPIIKTFVVRVFKRVWMPNAIVQQRGRLVSLHTSESRDAGPVCCNASLDGRDLGATHNSNVAGLVAVT